MSATCGSCGRAIIWAQTAAGKSMPVDVEPSDGNLILTQPLDPREPTDVRVLRKGERTTGLRYTSHFATCAFADHHRRLPCRI